MSNPRILDRIRETTTTTGTGTITLANVAAAGYLTFASVLSDGDTCCYCIAGQGTSEWEVGVGTFTASGTTLARTTVLASSNSGAHTSFSAGTKDIFIDLPAVFMSLLPFVGSGTGHAAGAVPDPGASSGTTHFLREDATWAVPALDHLANPTGTVSLNSQRIVSVGDPSSAQDAATKNYVDLATAALAPKDDVQCATTAVLAASTYANGTAGVGATLTANSAAVLIIDGYAVALGDRVLVKNQASAVQNGLYAVTTLGSISVATVMTRTLDFDQPGDGVNGALVYVLNGTVNSNTLWSCTTGASITFGTTNINWTKFLGSTYTADNATLTLTGTTFSITSGGVGSSQLASNLTLSGQTRMDSHYGAITADTDGATITFDMSVTDKHAVTLGGNRTLAVTNVQIGQGFVVILAQDGAGSRTVTWWSNIKWASGTVPTLTLTAGKKDMFSFIKTGSTEYLGMSVLNF